MRIRLNEVAADRIVKKFLVRIQNTKGREPGADLNDFFWLEKPDDRVKEYGVGVKIEIVLEKVTVPLHFLSRKWYFPIEFLKSCQKLQLTVSVQFDASETLLASVKYAGFPLFKFVRVGDGGIIVTRRNPCVVRPCFSLVHYKSKKIHEINFLSRLWSTKLCMAFSRTLWPL